MKEIRTLQVSNDLRMEATLEEGKITEVVVVANARKCPVGASDLDSVVSWLRSLGVGKSGPVSPSVNIPGGRKLEEPRDTTEDFADRKALRGGRIGDMVIEDRSSEIPGGGIKVTFGGKSE